MLLEFTYSLPIYQSSDCFLEFGALLFGFLYKDKGVKVVSLAIMIVAIAGGLIAFQTGELLRRRSRAFQALLKKQLKYMRSQRNLQIYS